MIWIILVSLGVPLWLCAVGLFMTIYRNRSIRHRPGNVPVRVRADGAKRWKRGHGVWVHDIFAFRGSPAAWQEELMWVGELVARRPTAGDLHKLRRLDDPCIVTVSAQDADVRLEIAAQGTDRLALRGPFATASDVEGSGVDGRV